MKRYTITVNGNAYDVTVDEADGSAAPVAAPLPRRQLPLRSLLPPLAHRATQPLTLL